MKSKYNLTLLYNVFFPLSLFLVGVGCLKFINVIFVQDVLVSEYLEPEDLVNIIRAIVKSTLGILTGFAAAVYIRFWYKSEIFRENKDYGLLFLSAVMVVWSVINLAPRKTPTELILIASNLTNLFLLSALYYFEYGSPPYKWKIFTLIQITKENYLKKILTIGIVIAFIELAFTSFGIYLELLASILTLILLERGLYLSFDKRKFPWVARLTIFTLLITIIAQIAIALHYAFELGVRGTIFALAMNMVYMLLLIFLISALAVSWADTRQLNRLEFQKSDMVHLIKNSLKNMKLDYDEQLSIQSKSGNEKIVNIIHDNIIRIEALRDLFEEIYNERIPYGVFVQDHIDKVFNILQKHYEFSYFQYNIQFKELKIADSEPVQHLAKIFVEICINAFKYGNKWIAISGKVENDTLLVTFKDKGKGYKKNTKRKGFGITMIEKYTDELNGTINYSFTEAGTIIYLSIPVYKFAYRDEDTPS